MEAEAKKSNTLLYIGIGAVVLIIGAVVLITICASFLFAEMEAESSTAAGPPRVLSLSERLQNGIDDKMGASGTVRRAAVTDGVLNVRFDVAENTTDSLTDRGARNAILSMIRVLQGSGEDFDTVNFIGNYNGQQVIYATYTRQAIRTMDTDRIYPEDVYRAADEVVNRPAFQD